MNRLNDRLASNISSENKLKMKILTMKVNLFKDLKIWKKKLFHQRFKLII